MPSGGAGEAGAGEALSRALAGAEAAMPAAAAVGHAWLTAFAAAVGAGAAAQGGQEITGAVAIFQSTAPVERKRGRRHRRTQTMNPVPSGGEAR